MRIVLTPRQMRDVEARYFERSGVAPIRLMERAAREVLCEMEELLGGRLADRTAVFACGPGSNGGDGYAAARLFAEAGGRAIVLPLCPEKKLRGDALTNCVRARGVKGVYFADRQRLDGMPAPDLWVDAIFGIGLSRAMEEGDALIVRRMAEDRGRGAKVLAVDIPSGIDGRTGAALGAAVAADVTVSFQWAKTGHLLGDGPDYTGALRVRSIGIEEEYLPEDAARWLEPSDVARALKPRPRNSHKGDYGHLLIVAGSEGMAGAALFSAQAALRSGVGLVTVACVSRVAQVLQQRAPAAMCLIVKERDGAIAEEAVQQIEAAFHGKTALAIGPGLSRRAGAGIVRAALLSGLKAVFDADALNLIAEHVDLLEELRGHHVLTPHPGEAKRLLGGEPSDFAPDGAVALAGLGAKALLKGAATVIAGEWVTISTSGSPGMAKGGSGDVLTGILGALLAQGYPPEQAACLASEIHGLAGQHAEGEWGGRFMTAEELIGALKRVWRALEGDPA